MDFPHQLEWMERDLNLDLHQAKVERIIKGESVLDLSMINPDLEPPRLLLDKLAEATVRPPNHRYAVARGIRRLREAFAEKYAAKFGVSLDPEREVCITLGAKDAIINALPCTTRAGGKVIVGSPTYPAHSSGIKVSGLTSVFFQIDPDEDLMLRSISDCLQNSDARTILLNFPNNPTGVVVSGDFMTSVIELAKSYGAVVINDFVYGEMRFDGRPAASLLSAPGAKDLAVEAYSMSKAYSVPGWRVGALVGNETIIHRLSRLKSHLDYGIFLPLQIAASAALESSKSLVDETVTRYKQRVSTLLRGLNSLGWKAMTPQAGTAVWAMIPDQLCKEGSHAFCLELLNETGVLLTPGTSFGTQGSPHIRAAAVSSEEQIREVLELLSGFQKKRGLGVTNQSRAA